jgi:hypothetical protein
MYNVSDAKCGKMTAENKIAGLKGAIVSGNSW